jgi:hypothetical protein
MSPPWSFTLQIFTVLDGTFLTGINAPSIPIPMKRIKGKIKCVGELL